ncbi:MAG: cell division protein [Chromatiales bacterium]|nr:cell division protein [Chromatiales bacterium]
MNPARWLQRHLQTALGTLGTLSRQPVATGLTVLVIGMALALPAALHVLVQNARLAAGSFEDVRDFSAYLAQGTALVQAEALARELEARDEVGAVTLISAEDALEELRADPGIATLILALERNPLPHTLVIRPAEGLDNAAIQALADSLGPPVEMVRLDMDWLGRLAALFDVLRRAVLLAMLLLVSAVVIIIGNTIRLEIQNRRQDIEVMKLLGATDGFVRRPFLYLGLWYGLLGGLVALIVLLTGLAALGGPLDRLAALYGSGLRLTGLDGRTALGLLLCSLAAGTGGALLAVSRHLAAIQPRV